MTTEDTVAQFITATVTANPGIRGAKLGARVKMQFPGVYLGRLTQFINTHCANAVVASAQENLDYIWVPKPQQPPTSSDGTIPSEHRAPIRIPSVAESPWKVFTRSNTPGKLAVNSVTGQITVVTSAEDLAPPVVHVPPVTPAQYRSIALDFIKQIDEVDRPHFTSVAASSLFDTDWYQQIRNWRAGYYNKAWGAFSFDKLCNIFAESLASKGVLPAAIHLCVDSIKRLKTKEYFKEAPASAPQALRPFPRVAEPSLQDIVANAIKRLSDDDLRRVWLPVGVVLDATRNK